MVTATTLRPVEQKTFGPIEQGNKAMMMFQQFLIDCRLPGTLESLTGDLAFLLAYFDIFVSGHFPLASRNNLCSLTDQMLAALLEDTASIPIHKLQFVPIGDCNPRPSWVSKEAQRNDFFKLLFYSADLDHDLPSLLKKKRQKRWANVEALEKTVNATLAPQFYGPLKSLCYQWLPKDKKTYHWQHYASKLVAENPLYLIRECLIAYRAEDWRSFDRIKCLVEFFQQSLILAPEKENPETILILVAAD